MATRSQNNITTSRLGWMAAPAILSVASQFFFLGVFNRVGGESAALTFQTMSTLWAWTMVAAFGWDRAARSFARGAQGFSSYAKGWRARLWMIAGLGGALGGIGGARWDATAGAGPWVVFGMAVGVCAMGLAGREWLLAQGSTDGVGKRMCGAFLAGALIMGLMIVAKAPWAWIATMWFIPHALVWLWQCHRIGLLSKDEPAEGSALGLQAAAPSLGVPALFGLQAMGHVALGSLDVLIARQFISDSSSVFAYIIYGRLAFAAFIVSALFGSHFVGKAMLLPKVRWRGVFYSCACVHAGFAALSVGALAVAGPWITSVWLGGPGLSIEPADMAMLGLACLARSVCEAGMQTLSGAAMQRAAGWSALGSCVGLGIFTACLAGSLCSPMQALAIAWMTPALALLGWVALPDAGARPIQ